MLLSLPNMTGEKLEGFKSTLLGTGSEKAQREAIKKLLVRGGGCFPDLRGGWSGSGVCCCLPQGFGY